jgi:internalin A
VKRKRDGMSKRKLSGIIIGSVVAIVVIVALRTQIELPRTNDGVVQFADANLEAAVRETIDMPEGPIAPSDLQWLIYLELSARNIEDLTGLEYLINLNWLTLQNNQVSDISVLASLTSLEELELSSNQIRDISPLANLTNLTWLDLSYNQISDISPLADLISLTALNLTDNHISDISALVDNEGISEGDEVYLSNNTLSSDSVNIYIPQLEARGVIVDY